MLITMTDFAESRGIDRDTVNAFIRKHPEIKEYTHREGKNVVIDTECEGYEALDKQYPLPKPIQIIEDTESRRKLIQAQELIIQLQAKLNSQTELIATANATQLLLDDKKEQLKENQKQLEVANGLVEQANKKTEQLEREVDSLREQLEQERKKSWIDKLLGR